MPITSIFQEAGAVGYHNEKAVKRVKVEKDKLALKRIAKSKLERYGWVFTTASATSNE